jgi:hypothetical protein
LSQDVVGKVDEVMALTVASADGEIAIEQVSQLYACWPFGFSGAHDF